MAIFLTLHTTILYFSRSNDGRTFLIKEPDIFAVEIIPQYFKHNNLSSFVRQLNFYGFRKIKNDVIRLDDVNETTASKYLRFRHEKFLRGRPDLLIEIRKANQTNAADQQEVDDLKQEVAQLKSQFARLSSIVQQLTDGSTLNSSKPASKKRKLEADVVSSHPIAPSPVEDMDDMPYPVVPLLDPMVSDADLLVEDFPTGYTNSFPPPLTKYNHSRAPSCDLVESMFDFVNDGQPEHVPSQTVAPSPVNSAPPAVHSDAENMFGNPAPEPSQMDQTPSQKLNDALSALPHNLQETFVERIVESLTNPEAFSKHVEAVSVLATAAAIEAENQTLISNCEHGAPANTNNDPVQKEEPDKLSMKNQSEMTLPVAAAALGAFLAKYGNAKENKDVSNCTPQQ